MKKLRQTLAYVAAALALLICVGLMYLWPRSYSVGDFVLLPLPRPLAGISACYLATGRGGTAFGAIKVNAPTFRWEYTKTPTYGNGGWSWATERYGFDGGATYVRGLTIYAVVLPDYFLMLLSLIGVAWLAWPGPDVRRRRARQLANCCRHCEYDLTENVSGACPVCGTPR